MKQYQKRPYRADCEQWTGDNFEVIAGMMPEHAVTRYSDKYLMIRHTYGISTLDVGHWVVRGENGYVKTYSDEVFRVKYMEVTCQLD